MCCVGELGSLELSEVVESYIQVVTSMNPRVNSKLNWPSCDLKTAHINYLRIRFFFLFPMISLYKTLLKPLLIVLQFAFPLEVPTSNTGCRGIQPPYCTLSWPPSPTLVFWVLDSVASCFTWGCVKGYPTLPMCHMLAVRWFSETTLRPLRRLWALCCSWLL